MQIKTILNKATLLFSKCGINSSYLDAELLLSFVLKKPKEFFYTHPKFELTKTQLRKINSLIQKRVKHVPLSYIIHNQEFFGLNFWVNKNVLIPRPESEILVETIIDLVEKNFKHKTITIADIGTGSGCLAISIAKNIKHSEIHATDISRKSLYVARKNIANNQVTSQIILHHGNLLQPIFNKRIDILVANLPYVPSGYAKKLNKFYNKSLKFEPASALYSGTDGLDHYRRFFKQIKSLKFLPKFIFIEIDSSQVLKLKKIIHSNISSSEIKTIKDYNKKNRFIQISLS